MPPPKYMRVADGIREQIRAGKLKPGDRLPTTGQLRELYGVGYGAVREAVNVLKAAGVIITQPGEARIVAGADEVPVGVLLQRLDELETLIGVNPAGSDLVVDTFRVLHQQMREIAGIHIELARRAAAQVNT